MEVICFPGVQKLLCFNMALLNLRKEGRIYRKFSGFSYNTWTNVCWVETWSSAENAVTKWTKCCCQSDCLSTKNITNFSKSFLSAHLFQCIHQLKLQLSVYGHQWPLNLHHFMPAAVNVYLMKILFKDGKSSLNYILGLSSLRRSVVVTGNITKLSLSLTVR